MDKIESHEIEQRLERFRAAARGAGVKLTHQRLEIFREIASSSEHPDAEAVLRGIQPRMPTVSLDTVYRTLWVLNDLGLITTLGPRRGSVRFDANLRRHHHYICVRCGLMRDFESTDLDGLRIPRVVKSIGSVADTHVEVRGICAQCEAEAAEPQRSKRPQRPRAIKRTKR